MARPVIKINWEDFDKLCHIQCTQEEIASFFDCSIDTVARAVKREKKMGYAEYFKRKSEGGKISLRRQQFQAAQKGNITMLIFLGKQYLGQSDKIEQRQNSHVEVTSKNQIVEEIESILKEKKEWTKPHLAIS